MSAISTIRALLRGSVIVVFSVVPMFAQSQSDQSRPRTITRSAQALSSEPPIPTGASEAKEEAKKAYKSGVIYGNAGLFSQAVELFKRAIRFRPDYADAYRSLGHAYYDLKDWDQSVAALERALELNPKDKNARQQLDLSRAMVEAERNETKQPKSSENAKHVSEISLTKLYLVGPGDVLAVKVGTADPILLSVNSSGTLTYPNLPESIKVDGHTIDEISAQLETALSHGSSGKRNPVSVDVHEYVSHVIMVGGLVKEPGPKILRREAIPLSVIVTDAQPLAEAERAIVMRHESNQAFTIDLAQPSEMNLLVRPRDVITLQTNPKEFFYVSGDVVTPGEHLLRRGLTLTQALIVSGGLVGKPKEARIGRNDAGGFLVVTRYQLKDIESGKVQDPLVQPGDRITVSN
jgi:protein involved in polysaccharide export with SLBB domain